ncbi:hypothetical protein BJX99DRAFT_218158 [Aspergillus californicus]
MLFQTLPCLLAVSFATLALGKGHQQAPISTLYQFPLGSWLENIEIGPSNTLLTTRIDIPALYQITVPTSKHPQPAAATLIQTFPNASGVLGITNFKKDHYAVVVGNFSLATSQSTPGSYSIWDVDLSGPSSDPVSATKITDIPEAAFLNGLTTLNPIRRHSQPLLLISDSQAGAVFSLDPETGKYDIIHDDETMAPANGTNIGINGLHPVVIGKETFLYYTNSLKETVNRVKINPVTGKATGPYTTIATGVWGDDFAYDTKKQDLYITGNFEDVVTKLSLTGAVEGVIGSETEMTVAGATSGVFGGDRGRTLFVATGGALAAPVNGTVTEGAKIVAIRVDEL